MSHSTSRCTRGPRFLFSLACAGLLACAGAPSDSELAEDADQALEATSLESALTSEVADETEQPTAVAAAAAAAARLPARFQPSGCLTSALDETKAKVVYTFNNCTGPYGLANVTGSISVVYSIASASSVRAAVNSTGLKANGATLDVNATVVASKSGTTKSAEVTSNSSGTSTRGLSVSRQGTYTTIFDTATECLVIDGTWQTKAGVRTSTTTFVAYERCKGKCPADKSKIVHTATPKGSAAVTLTYDGSAVAKWSTAAGRSGTVNLQCTAN